MIKRLPSLTLSRLLMIIAILAVFVMAVRAPLDTDALWHLRAGEWQMQNRAFLRWDEFSNSRPGDVWKNHSWLAQVIMYLVYLPLGDAGLSLYMAVLAAGGLFFVYLLCDGDPLVRAFSVILGGATAAVFWTPRPQMASFFLSTVVFYLLWLYQRRGVDRLWSIPPVMMLWANLHGGYAIGFILMVLSIAGDVLRWFFDGVLGGPVRDTPADPPTLKPVKRIIIVGLVSALASCINPLGPQVLLVPFETVGISVLRDFIQEWSTPDFHRIETWPFIWLLSLTVAAAGLSRKRLDWRDAIFVTGFAYGSLLAGRNIAAFAVVAPPVLSLHLNDLMEERRIVFKWNRLPTRGLYVALNWILLLLILGASAYKVAYALSPDVMLEAQKEWLPADATEFIRETRPPQNLFNSYNWGGYLIWELRDYPVYVDGRTDLYGDELLKVYMSLIFAQPGWEAKLDQAGINTVMVEPYTPLARVLSVRGSWEQVYADDVAIVFVREEPLDQ